jgi:GT2 family glycosyltransferase
MLDREVAGGEVKSDKTCRLAERKKGLIVLGMHRSGTSALTRVVSLAGAGLPADLMGPDKSNPRGHWESVRLTEYNDRLLKSLNSQWSDWRSIDLYAIPEERRREIVSELSAILEEEYAQERIFVVKDPRICRTAPLLLDALRQANIDSFAIVAVRNPLEVASSLERRDGMSRAHSILLWLRHALEAEANTRDMPRVVVCFDDLLQDWESCVGRISKELGIAWPNALADIAPEVEAFLAPEQRHHFSSVEALLIDPALRGLVGDAYSALLALARDSEDQAALKVLDRTRESLDLSAPIFQELVESLPKAELRAVEARLTASEAQNTKYEAKNKAIARELKGRKSQLAVQANQMRRQSGETKRLAGKVHALEAQVAGIYSSTSWKLTAPIRFLAQRFPWLRRKIRPAALSGLGLGKVVRVARFKAWQYYNGPNRLKQRTLAESLVPIEEAGPKFSVIMPVYDPPLGILDEAIESVLEQTYKNLELILVDDCSTNPEVRVVIRRWAARDPRIKTIFCDRHGHISKATNRGAETADGDFFTFVDHDDVLPPNALAQFALHLASNPTDDIVYSDDAKLDPAGAGLISPKLKSDWSPELLLSYCYVSHLKVITASLYKAVGGCRVGFEGSQDHDLMLRASEKARHVGHIAQILYHRRILPGSTASSGHAKPYSFEAARRAVEEAFHRRGVLCRITHPRWAWERGMGIYAPVMPDTGPSVAIVILTQNNAAALQRLLTSLEQTAYQNYRVYIIESGTNEPETAACLSGSRHRVIRAPSPDGKSSFARLYNEAAKQIAEDYILIMDDQTQAISANWLSQMVGWLRLPGVGAVGTRLLLPDGSVQHAGFITGPNGGLSAFQGLPRDEPGYLALAKATRNVSAVSAAAMLTPRSVFVELGGFDEENFPAAYTDIDYCLRLQGAGYRVVFCGDSELYHHEGERFSGAQFEPTEVAALRRQLRGREDPYYSRHLDRESKKFDIKPTVVPPVALKSPLRVLAVTHNLNHEGAPNSALELILGLKQRGLIDPVVISPREGPLRKEYERAGMPVRIVPIETRMVGDLAEYDRRLEAFCASVHVETFDLVYANTATAYWAIDAARLRGVPSIWNIRESAGWGPYLGSLPQEVQLRARRSFATAYRVVFVAEDTRKKWAFVDQTSNFQVISNGLNTSDFHKRTLYPSREEARQTLGLTDQNICILSLGTVCRRKSQIDLVRALQLMTPDAIDKLTVFIVGWRREDSYGDGIRDLLSTGSAELRDKVHLVEETREAGIYWNAADIFCCTSRIESYPRVILEAMAKDLPIVTTPVFGIRQQVREQFNGLFYEPGDVASLAAHLQLLVEDGEFRKRLASNSRVALAGLVSYAEMLDEYERVFLSAAFSSVPVMGATG